MNPEDTNQYNDIVEPSPNTAVFKSKRKSRKKWAVILVVTLFVVSALGIATNRRATNYSEYGVIVLSNGKEITLGQSLAQLEKAMGDNIRKTVEGTYEYPGNNDVKNPLQARIFVENNKLVAVRLRANEDNKQKRTGIYPRMPISEIANKTDYQAKEVGEPIEGGAIQGYMFSDSRVISYYLVNPCSGGILPDELVLVALALKGYEDTVKKDGAGCGVRI